MTAEDKAVLLELDRAHRMNHLAQLKTIIAAQDRLIQEQRELIALLKRHERQRFTD